MHYEYGGSISVKDAPEGTNPIREAVDQIMADKEGYGDCTELIEMLDIMGDHYYCSMDGYDFGGTYDDMGDMESFFYAVRDKVMELYPDCSMDAHFNGFNSSSGDEEGFRTQLRDRHVKDLDYGLGEDGLSCPDCDEYFTYLSDVEFDCEYDCEECGKHITVDEMNEILAPYLDEYDLPDKEA